jgi:DNA polymerase
VGAAGGLLDKMIEGMQGELRKARPDAVFSRQSDAFVLNVCQCRPPMNRKPERSEVEVCSPNLWAILRALPRVRIVVALGATPLQAVSGQLDAKIIRLRGQWLERCLPGDESRVLRVMPTFHPAYLLRSPWEKPKAWTDLLEVVAEMRGAM